MASGEVSGSDRSKVGNIYVPAYCSECGAPATHETKTGAYSIRRHKNWCSQAVYPPEPRPHTDIECHGECGKPYGCMFCTGGLWGCSVCGGLEGGMPSECPGYWMNWDRMEEVYKGAVDFRAGRWVNKPSPYSPKGINAQVEQDV